MNKHLRYTLMSMLMMVCGWASAQVITFDPAVDLGTQASSSTGEDQVTKSGVTIAASPTGSFGNGQQYRVYKGSDFTVTSTAGNITKVEITCTASDDAKYGPGCFSAPTAGSYAYEGTIGTWTGNASSFSMNATSNQVRMTLVKVTIGDGGDHEEPPVEGAIVFDATVDLGTQAGSSSEEDHVTKNGVTIAALPVGSFGNGQQYRVYKNSDFIVTSTVGDITKIVVTCTASGEEKYGPGCLINPTSGSYTFEGNTGTWTGSASSVSMNAAEYQVRMTKVEVYIGGEVQKVLTISGTTPFTTSTTVTITPSNADYAVYYTLDGSDPRTSSTQQVYSAPFTLTATTTVKAVEEDLAGVLSDVVEKTFVKEQATDIPTVNDIAAFKALESGTEATLKLNNAQVLYALDRDVYVRDATGAVEFYNTQLGFETGQVLNGEITGKFSPYNGLPELVSTSNTDANTFTATAGEEPLPVSTSISQLNESLLCDLVEFPATLSKEEAGTFANSGDSKILLYDKFKVLDDSTPYGQDCYVKGILVIYKGDLQVYPTAISNNSGIQELSGVLLDSNAPMYNLSGQKVGPDCKGVIIQNGKKLILK